MVENKKNEKRERRTHVLSDYLVVLSTPLCGDVPKSTLHGGEQGGEDSEEPGGVGNVRVVRVFEVQEG